MPGERRRSFPHSLSLWSLIARISADTRRVTMRVTVKVTGSPLPSLGGLSGPAAYDVGTPRVASPRLPATRTSRHGAETLRPLAGADRPPLASIRHDRSRPRSCSFRDAADPYLRRNVVISCGAVLPSVVATTRRQSPEDACDGISTRTPPSTSVGCSSRVARDRRI
jgi:hypothetical protein